jgi:6-phosphofructokinase 1
MQTRLVNIDGERYEVAKGYMIHLEAPDFADDKALKALADVINTTPEKFKEEFGYLVK